MQPFQFRKRWRMFENGVLRRKSGPIMEGEMGWRKLHNEELENVYFSPDIIIMFKSVDCSCGMHGKI
jgi:hypothetical protein